MAIIGPAYRQDWQVRTSRKGAASTAWIVCSFQFIWCRATRHLAYLAASSGRTVFSDDARAALSLGQSPIPCAGAWTSNAIEDCLPSSTSLILSSIFINSHPPKWSSPPTVHPRERPARPRGLASVSSSTSGQRERTLTFQSECPVGGCGHSAKSREEANAHRHEHRDYYVEACLLEDCPEIFRSPGDVKKHVKSSHSE